MEVGQYFSRTNILVLASGGKHSTVEYRHRNEIEKWAWTARRDQDYPRPPPKPFNTLPERTRGMYCDDN